MAKYQKNQKPSDETKAEAMEIARGTQRPGQTKEQTRLIAQGIQKGIEQYKKQYKSRVRELDKKHKKESRSEKANNPDGQPEIQVVYKQHWLPWLLLVISLGIIAALKLNFL